jgi:lipopolysaccharide core heptose(I) kinase
MMADTLFLRDDLAAAWCGDDPFERIARLEGEVFRDVPARRTLRFEAAGRSYFAKVHFGVGWREILKNLLVLRRPVIDASNEYRACLLLPKFGVATAAPAAFGIRGRSPASRQSFIVCDELTDHVSLATLTEDWHEHPPAPVLKRTLIQQVAELTRAMHGAGVVHRDYYLYHLLVDRRKLESGMVALSLIDLHRAQLRRRVPPRWRVRDLGALLFWCLDLPITRRDRLRFIRAYERRPLREVFQRDGGFWRRVQRRGIALYRKGMRKGLVAGHLPGGLDE